MTKGNETKLWAEVTPEMMSDEEFEPDEKLYVRHQPSYRSDKLTKFIKKLDLRLDSENKGTHPRLQRRLGSPREKPTPTCTKRWTVKKVPEDNHSSDEDDGHAELELEDDHDDHDDGGTSPIY